jgi:hypothetical protein
MSQTHKDDMESMSMHHSAVFHFGFNEVILFPFWEISSPLGLFFSCLIIMTGCVFLEWIRWLRQHAKRSNRATVWTSEKGNRVKR